MDKSGLIVDEIRTILENLDGTRLSYVYARSKSKTAAEAYNEVGISKSAYYKWEDRERLEELANELRRNRVLMAEPKLQEAIEEAVDVLIKLLHAKDERVQFQAARTIIEREMGLAPTRMDITSGGKPVQSATIEGMTKLFQQIGQREQQQHNEDGDDN